MFRTDSSSSTDITSLPAPSSGSLDPPESTLAITCHRLNGNNYLEWSQSIKIYVAGRGRSGYLNGSLKQPSDTTDSVGAAKWIQENNQVMSWLLNSMIPSVGRNFLLYTSAADIWNAVQETYSSKDNDSALYGIEEQIFALKQEGLGVTAYFNSLQSLWQQIDLYENNDWSTPNDALLYQTLITKRRIFRFLHGLNREFDSLRGRVLSTSPLPSLREVFSMVKKEESRREVMLSPPSAADSSALLTSSSSKKGRPWCDHCKKLGHVRDRCWKLHGKPLDFQTRGPPKSPPNAAANAVFSSFSKEQILDLQRMFGALTASPPMVAGPSTDHGSSPPSAHVSTASKPSWIIDSGASDHMTGNKALFSSYSPVSTARFITTAAGSQSLVLGVGTVCRSESLSLSITCKSYQIMFRINSLLGVL
ncbi:hypothetical protein GQ457_03G025720 [Hibiscus cannabinus]